MSTLKELIASTHELQALPQSTARLLDLLEDPLVEADKLLAVIEKDPALTANLLKLCNSAYYGRKREVGSVKEALVMLGNRTVITLAFATSMGKVLRGDLAAYGLGKEDLWRHSLATACGAALVAADLGLAAQRDRAFTAGLVHDIGKMLLNRLLLKRLEWSTATAADSFVEIEREVLGFDHAEAGAALAEAWHFPAPLVAAVRHHHEPAAPADADPIVTAVRAANLLTAVVGYGGGQPSPHAAVPDGAAPGAPAASAPAELPDVGLPPEVARHVVAALPEQLENLAVGGVLRQDPALSLP